MRLLLAVTLALLFLWLHNSQTSNDTFQGNPCKAVSMSEAVVYVFLSPLSLYSLLVATLLRLVLSIPALVLSALYHSLLLLLAGPWCAANIGVSLLLTCLYVALYLLHLALVVGVVAMLTLTWHKRANRNTPRATGLNRFRELEMHHTKHRPKMFGRRDVQQG